jgi:hypothetical protein
MRNKLVFSCLSLSLGVSMVLLFQNCGKGSSGATNASPDESKTAPAAASLEQYPYTGAGGAVWNQVVQFNSDGSQTVNISFNQPSFTVPAQAYPQTVIVPNTCAILDLNAVLASNQAPVTVETLACNTTGGGDILHRVLSEGSWSAWVDHGSFTSGN